MKYIKSPLNYTGRKYKILEQILPLFPTKINKFVDLFCGGGDVFINIDANRIIANDICSQVIELFKKIQKDGHLAFDKVISIMDEYELSKTNKEGYYDLRNWYNERKLQPYDLYLLAAHSFSNQIRFNKQGEFNMPFGKRTFNTYMQENFKTFTEELSKKNIEFSTKDFRDFSFEGLNSDDFVYVDPPYWNSVAPYNESKGWTEQDESDLLIMLDSLNKKNIKFALSNVTHHKGQTNDLLIEFAKCYNVHDIKTNYKNCNYQVKEKNRKSFTKEVLMTNY